MVGDVGRRFPLPFFASFPPLHAVRSQDIEVF